MYVTIHVPSAVLWLVFAIVGGAVLIVVKRLL